VIRVLVVAPMIAMRAGLRVLLSASPGVEIAGEAASLLEAGADLPRADVLVLTEEAIPPANLEHLLDHMEAPPAVLLLCEDASAVQEFLGLHWRAWGILSADAAQEELAAAVHALQEGLLVGQPAMVKAVISQPPAVQDQEILPGDVLTAREAEVLQLLAQGLANKQIGLSLGISEHTVKFHVSSLYSKLGVSNRTEAVRKGFQRGLVTL